MLGRPALESCLPRITNQLPTGLVRSLFEEDFLMIALPMIRVKEKRSLKSIAEHLIRVRLAGAGLHKMKEAEYMKKEDYEHTNPLSLMTTDGMAGTGETT